MVLGPLATNGCTQRQAPYTRAPVRCADRLHEAPPTSAAPDWSAFEVKPALADMSTEAMVESRMGAVAWGLWPALCLPFPFIEPDVPIRAHCQILIVQCEGVCSLTPLPFTGAPGQGARQQESRLNCTVPRAQAELLNQLAGISNLQRAPSRAST
jgi:hypothetical protein